MSGADTPPASTGAPVRRKQSLVVASLLSQAAGVVSALSFDAPEVAEQAASMPLDVKQMVYARRAATYTLCDEDVLALVDDGYTELRLTGSQLTGALCERLAGVVGGTLQRLDVVHASDDLLRALPALLARCTALEHLRVCGVPAGVDLYTIVRAPARPLRSLGIQMCLDVDEAVCSAVAEAHGAALETLRLAFCGCTSRGIHLLAMSGLPALRRARLENLSSVDGHAVRALLFAAPGLERLCVRNCRCVDGYMIGVRGALAGGSSTGGGGGGGTGISDHVPRAALCIAQANRTAYDAYQRQKAAALIGRQPPAAGAEHAPDPTRVSTPESPYMRYLTSVNVSGCFGLRQHFYGALLGAAPMLRKLVAVNAGLPYAQHLQLAESRPGLRVTIM